MVPEWGGGWGVVWEWGWGTRRLNRRSKDGIMVDGWTIEGQGWTIGGQVWKGVWAEKGLSGWVVRGG